MVAKGVGKVSDFCQLLERSLFKPFIHELPYIFFLFVSFMEFQFSMNAFGDLILEDPQEVCAGNGSNKLSILCNREEPLVAADDDLLHPFHGVIRFYCRSVGGHILLNRDLRKFVKGGLFDDLP